MPETPTLGRYAEIPYDEMTPEQQEGFRSVLETRGANLRWVSKGLCDRTVEALGHVGTTDVICLMGFYTWVSMTIAFMTCRSVQRGWRAEQIG